MWTLSFQQGWQAREPQRASCLHLTWPTLGLKAGTTVLNFFVVAEGPDSGDHACSANTLPIGLSSQFPEENSSKSKTRGGPHLCIHALVYPCTHVCPCTYAPMHPRVPCTYASMHSCTHAPMHLCTNAPTHLCIHAPLHPCIHVPMHLCIQTPMHPYTHEPMHPCIHAPMLRSCITYTHECASCGEGRWTENSS